MPAWNLERFHRSLQGGEIAQVYCVFGEETFLVEEAVNQLIEKGLDGAPHDFNVDVFYGTEADGSRIKDAIEMLPMMARRRVVILKDADSLKAKDLEDLLPVVDQPIDSTLFVIVAEKIDQRKKFFKSIEKNGALVKMDRLPEQQLPSWIRRMAKVETKEIAEDAIMLLIQMVGSSLLDIRNEVRKLSHFVGTRSKIAIDDVKAVVSHSRMESVFGLTNAVGERDHAKALTFLAQLLDHGESEVGILALISRHMRILLMTKEAQAAGLTKPQIATRVGVPSFFVQDYIQQAQLWTLEQLEHALESCLETDRALKSSPISGHIWLENFILSAR